MQFILALDQSTSATKALLFDTLGTLVDKVSVEHQQYYPQPGWVEHDAEEIYHNALEALRELLLRNRSLAGDILCLSITNQRETFVVFDAHTGRPLCRAIVWQCRRGDVLCEQMIAAGHGARVQQVTGLKIDTYFPAAKIRWLLENRPEIADSLARGEALLGTMDTYLLFRLTQGRCFASEHTNASRTLLYDIVRLRWDEGLCRLFGVPMRALPEVLESRAVFAQTDLEGLLERAIPICGVMGDSQAALFAEHCFQPGGAKVTLGTGSSVLLNIGERMRLSENGLVTTIAWVYGGRATYALEGLINYAGATVSWLKERLKLIADPAETEALSEELQDNGGVYLVPAFVGLSAPYWSQGARAAIVGLTPHSTRSHVARAALESIAYQVRDVLALMGDEAALPLRYVCADGGMVHNRFLVQFMADITRMQVRASALPELSALGAAMAGMLGLGMRSSLEDLDSLEHGFSVYEPAMGEAIAEEYYRGWKAAVRRVL